MAKLNKTVIAALSKIIETGRVTKEVGEPLIAQGLIEVNTSDVVDGLAAARLTQVAMDAMPQPKQATNPTSNYNTGNTDVNTEFQIITNAVPPSSKRGTGRQAGPSKYPFDQLPAGGSFFVAASADMQDPLKTMGSAVSNATNKYRVDTGKTETKTRTKRGEGNKAMLDAEGKKIKETVSVPVYEYPRKFVIRSVKKDQKCGDWVAPADGVLIARTH